MSNKPRKDTGTGVLESARASDRTVERRIAQRPAMNPSIPVVPLASSCLKSKTTSAYRPGRENQLCQEDMRQSRTSSRSQIAANSYPCRLEAFFLWLLPAPPGVQRSQLNQLRAGLRVAGRIARPDASVVRSIITEHSQFFRALAQPHESPDRPGLGRDLSGVWPCHIGQFQLQLSYGV